MEEERQVDPAKLIDLGLLLAKSRSEAIEGRETCGIEQEWIEDEEYYEGIDDANRGENRTWRGKPPGQAALRNPNATSSTVFPNITRPYCEAAAARVGDMLLPTDDRSWAIKPTPVPALTSIVNGKIPIQIDRQIQEQVSPEMQAQTKKEIIDEITKDYQEATEKSNKAQRRIEDWHTECQYHAQMRTVIEDSSRAGTGVLKGPIPKKSMGYAFIGGKLQKDEDIKPVSRRVDFWNCFPDPACGENIHNGSYFWERDDITKKELYDLIDTPGYLEDQIVQILREGPKKASKEYDAGRGIYGLSDPQKAGMFEIWYGYCQLTKEDMESAGVKVKEELVFAQVTMVNNTIIKAALNPLDTGDFPYDFMPWQRRAGSPWGIGVARQIRTAQRMVVGACRNMMDNAGLAGGPMWIVDTTLIQPVNGVYELAPRKGWRPAENAVIKNMAEAFIFIEIPMIQEKLQNIIMLGLKLAEDTTGLPLIMQGQQGKAPDTVGGMQILNNNASTVLRRIARMYDDMITEPHVRRYYNYLLQYGENDDEKGDFSIDARGSSALVERDIQNQVIQQMASIVANPIFGKDPKKWMDEYLKSQHLDPKRFDYDDEEWQKIVEQLSQQPQDNSVAIAQLKAETAERIKAFEIQLTQQENDKDRAQEAAMKEVDLYIKQLESQGKSTVELNKVRAMLTANREKLNTQILLNGTNAATPAVEPKGRAPEGQAFQK